MPPKKKVELENKIEVRRFKDHSSHFWVSNHHYYLDENNEIQYASGGIDTVELREVLKAYCKRNKVTFVEREPSILDQIEKEYNSIFTFGKHKSKSVQTVFYEDNKWLIWCRDNFNFSSAENKIKEEIIEILKK